MRFFRKAKKHAAWLAMVLQRDGIVAARAARGLAGESDKAVEVSASHMGFGVSRRGTRAAVGEIVKFLEDVDRQPPV